MLIKRTVFTILTLFITMLFQTTAVSETLTNSKGVTYTINNIDDAHKYWNDHEDYLDEANGDMIPLTLDRKIIEYAYNQNMAELQKAASVGVLAAGFRQYGIGLAGSLLTLLNNNELEAITRQLIAKYGEIQEQNYVITKAAQDRDLFYDKYVEYWKAKYGADSKPPDKKRKADTQYVPPGGLKCEGGCGHNFVSQYHQSFHYWSLYFHNIDYPPPDFVSDKYTLVPYSQIISSSESAHK